MSEEKYQQKYENQKKENAILKTALEIITKEVVKDSYGAECRRTCLIQELHEEAIKTLKNPNYKAHLIYLS